MHCVRKEKIIATLTGGLAQLAKRRKVEVVHAKAWFENSTTLRLERLDQSGRTEELTYDHCILATGSRPFKIPTFDLPTPRVMDSTGALELPDVPESLLVVGGGYIGLEMGTVYAQLGSKVTVVELTDGLLPGADRDLVRPLGNRLEKLMAAILLSTKVISLTDKGDAIDVKMQSADGSNERVEKFSRVLVSVGRRPNSDGIGLENTKITLDKRGFALTDNRQQTDDEHIFAIGDVAGEPMLAHKAAHQGKVAVEALHGEPAVFEPACDSSRRVHRSGNRLGRTYRGTGQTRRPRS